MVFSLLASYIKLLMAETRLNLMEREICQYGEIDIIPKAGCIPMQKIQKRLSEGKYSNYYCTLKLYKNDSV